jgi:hypothetical protein
MRELSHKRGSRTRHLVTRERTFSGGRFGRGYVPSLMDPYAKPTERKIGAHRPQISHLPRAVDTRTAQQRQADKQAVAAERRAIKKSARRHLKQELLDELAQ